MSGCHICWFRVHIILNYAVAQFVETLRYKPEDGGFDFRWGHWNFSSTSSFRPHYDPGKWVQGIFTGGKGGRCLGLTSLPPSCADYLEILRASTFWNPKSLSRPVMRQLYLYLTSSSPSTNNYLHRWQSPYLHKVPISSKIKYRFGLYYMNVTL